MVTVKEMKEFLKDKDDDMEIYCTYDGEYGCTETFKVYVKNNKIVLMGS